MDEAQAAVDKLSNERFAPVQNVAIDGATCGWWNRWSAD